MLNPVEIDILVYYLRRELEYIDDAIAALEKVRTVWPEGAAAGKIDLAELAARDAPNRFRHRPPK